MESRIKGPAGAQGAPGEAGYTLIILFHFVPLPFLSFSLSSSPISLSPLLLYSLPISSPPRFPSYPFHPSLIAPFLFSPISFLPILLFSLHSPSFLHTSSPSSSLTSFSSLPLYFLPISSPISFLHPTFPLLPIHLFSCPFSLLSYFLNISSPLSPPFHLLPLLPYFLPISSPPPFRSSPSLHISSLLPSLPAPSSSLLLPSYYFSPPLLPFPLLPSLSSFPLTSSPLLLPSYLFYPPLPHFSSPLVPFFSPPLHL